MACWSFLLNALKVRMHKILCDFITWTMSESNHNIQNKIKTLYEFMIVLALLDIKRRVPVNVLNQLFNLRYQSENGSMAFA